MIVVISYPDDVHASRVIDLLRARGDDVLLLDLSTLPQSASVTADYDHRGVRRLEYRAGAAVADLLAARSCWWRRPQAPLLPSTPSFDVHAFTLNEWQEAVNGMWQLMDCPWMNPPSLDEVASRKMLQLHVAAGMGLRIPRTLITSDPEAARAFVAEQGLGRTIFKTFSCTHAIWRETRLLSERELGMLEHVSVAPVIFQEYIEAAADLRVTVVGDRIFAASIRAAGTDYEVDFRMSLGQARTNACELPPSLTRTLFAFMKRLGLVYGAIDLRRTPAGDYVFLEVNTAGEFLFVEERTGLPIAAAVADWLAKPPGSRTRAADRRRPEPALTAS